MSEFEEREARTLKEVGASQYIGGLVDRLRARPTTFGLDAPPVIEIGPQGVLVSMSIGCTKAAAAFKAAQEKEATEGTAMAEAPAEPEGAADEPLDPAGEPPVDDETKDVETYTGDVRAVPDQDGGDM